MSHTLPLLELSISRQPLDQRVESGQVERIVQRMIKLLEK